jgi:hypothetical protein
MGCSWAVIPRRVIRPSDLTGYFSNEIVTPLGPRLRLSPKCVATISISTPWEFFIAVTLALPAFAVPAETAVYTPVMSGHFIFFPSP